MMFIPNLRTRHRKLNVITEEKSYEHHLPLALAALKGHRVRFKKFRSPVWSFPRIPHWGAHVGIFLTMLLTELLRHGSDLLFVECDLAFSIISRNNHRT